MNKPKSLMGQTFGRLRVLQRDYSSRRGTGLGAKWVCFCQCGSRVSVDGRKLRKGVTVSCGCYRRTKSVIDGRSSHPLYRTWRDMLRRVGDPRRSDYPIYGGRGIKVCPEWARSFSAFLQDVGEKPGPQFSLDRINVDGDYEPGNVRWADARTQSNNTRRNRVVEFNGCKQTVANLARTTGANAQLIRKRLDLGWSIERALTIASRRSK